MSVYVDLDILAFKKIENHCDTIATVLDVSLQLVKSVQIDDGFK